ncbi:SDR family oxidoreductase [soil metagenome]
MLLDGKIAVVYGAGGAMGGAVARAFAQEGARVFLAGRTLETLDRVAEEIERAGGSAQTAQVDAHDPDAVEAHVDGIAHEAGSIDACFNAVSINEMQGVPLVEMPLRDFLTPVTEAARTHFLTSTAAARRMTAQGSGVIVLLSSSAARESGYQMGGFSLACAAIECFARTLAGEVGRHGVRVVTLRPNFTPDSHPESLADPDALRPLIDGTALGRLPRLAEVAATAAFVASDHAGAMTGAVVNLTCGAIMD